MEAYESSLESNATAFIDVLDEVSSLHEYIKGSKRIDRNKLIETLSNIEKIMNNQI